MKTLIYFALFSLEIITASFAQSGTSSPKKVASNINRTETEAKAIIDTLYKKLINGENFKEIAKRYSEDSGTSRNGGEYHNITRGTFASEFENVVFNLKTNEISAPFKTPFGYHIAQVMDKKGDSITVRHILILFRK